MSKQKDVRNQAMAAPVFSSQSREPSDAELFKALGRAKQFWDGFLERAAQEHPRVTSAWKRYSTGWRLVLREKRRNLAYLSPSAKCFTVSFAFSDEAVAAAEQANLPDDIVEPMRRSPKYPEGRAVRIEVDSAKNAAIAAQLLAIKMAYSMKPRRRALSTRSR